MIKKYNPNYPFKYYLDLGKHQRSAICAQTNNCSYVEDVSKKGWSVEKGQNGKFRIKAPEISIIDIADPFQTHHPVFELHFFSFLDEFIKNGLFDQIVNFIICTNSTFLNLEWFVSCGASMETEIRIIGSDYRIRQLVYEVLDVIKKSKQWQEYFKNSLADFSEARIPVVFNRPINQHELKSQQLIHRISTNLRMKKPLNTHVVQGICEQLPPHDIIIMIPQGCFSFMTSFLSNRTSSKIMLWEIHNEPSKSGDSIWINKSICNKRCLIIDKAYSGKTIQMIAQRVNKLGGKPIKMSVFPKNYSLAVANSDFALFQDKILPTSCIPNGADWHTTLYKQILGVNRSGTI